MATSITGYSLATSTTSPDEGGSVTFTVRRSGDLPAEYVYFSTVSSTASYSEGDYEAADGSRPENIPVYFRSGASSETVRININDGDGSDGGERFRAIVQRDQSDGASEYLAQSSYVYIDEPEPTTQPIPDGFPTPTDKIIESLSDTALDEPDSLDIAGQVSGMIGSILDLNRFTHQGQAIDVLVDFFVTPQKVRLLKDHFLEVGAPGTKYSGIEDFLRKSEFLDEVQNTSSQTNTLAKKLGLFGDIIEVRELFLEGREAWQEQEYNEFLAQLFKVGVAVTTAVASKSLWGKALAVAWEGSEYLPLPYYGNVQNLLEDFFEHNLNVYSEWASAFLQGFQNANEYFLSWFSTGGPVDPGSYNAFSVHNDVSGNQFYEGSADADNFYFRAQDIGHDTVAIAGPDTIQLTGDNWVVLESWNGFAAAATSADRSVTSNIEWTTAEDAADLFGFF